MQMSKKRDKRGDCYKQWLEINDSTCDINDKKSAKAKKKNIFHIVLRIEIYHLNLWNISPKFITAEILELINHSKSSKGFAQHDLISWCKFQKDIPTGDMSKTKTIAKPAFIFTLRCNEFSYYPCALFRCIFYGFSCSSISEINLKIFKENIFSCFSNCYIYLMNTQQNNSGLISTWAAIKEWVFLRIKFWNSFSEKIKSSYLQKDFQRFFY